MENIPWSIPLSLISDIVPLLFAFRVRPGYQIEKCNAAAIGYFASSQGTLVGQNFCCDLPWSLASRNILAEGIPHNQSQRSFQIELSTSHKTFQCLLYRESNDDGLIGILCRETVSEEVQKTTQIRNFLRMVLDTISIGVFWKDVEGRYVGCNRAFLLTTGISSFSEVIGKTDFDMPWREIAHEIRQEDLSILETGVVGHIPITKEKKVRLADGVPHHIKSFKTLILAEDGSIQGVLGSSEDISHLYEAEANRREQDRQLLQADKMMSLGVLVAGIAHEINNPNNLIMMNSSMVTKIWSDAKPILQKEFASKPSLRLCRIPYESAEQEMDILLQGIVGGASRIRGITHGLKDYAGKDQGEAMDIVSVKSVVEASLMILGPTIQRHTHHFIVQHAESDLFVFGKKMQLEQVLINLLTNACHALPNMQGWITLAYRLREDGKVGISVEDSGAGIPSELLSKIREPFFTTRHASGGMGLGISIALGIVKAHHGSLDICSEQGKGTRVEIVLTHCVPKDRG